MSNTHTVPHHDQLHRYLFENYAVRGELVTLSKTFQQVLENHDYPAPVQTLLGEMLVATSLLTAILKFEGDITLQLQGNGPLSLAVINGNSRQEMRGIARLNANLPENPTLQQMLGEGFLVMTLTPNEGERYQGVVALEGESVAELVETYFRQSEQLPTRLFIRHGLFDNTPAVAGMLLQTLPAQEAKTEDFDHLAQLTETIRAEELLTLPANEVLYRLYHQEEVTLFAPQSVTFRCNCSKERTAAALLSVSAMELEEILQEDGVIDMHCDYCTTHYLFNREDVQVLLAESNNAERQH